MRGLLAGCCAAAVLMPSVAANAQQPTGNPDVQLQPGAPPPPNGAWAPDSEAQAAPSGPAQPAQGGQWVYTQEYGWVWVPAGTSTASVGGEPYAYLYAPSYGWTWFVSPWGWGPFNYGYWPLWGGHRYIPGYYGGYHGRGFAGPGWGGGWRGGYVGGPHFGGAPHFGGGGGHFGGGGGHFGGGGGHGGGHR